MNDWVERRNERLSSRGGRPSIYNSQRSWQIGEDEGWKNPAALRAATNQRSEKERWRDSGVGR